MYRRKRYTPRRYGRRNFIRTYSRRYPPVGSSRTSRFVNFANTVSKYAGATARATPYVVGAVGGLIKGYNYLKSVINSELKYNNIFISNSAYTANFANAVYSLSDVETGNTQITRIGNSIKIKSLDIKGYIRGNDNPTTVSTFPIIRIVIFWCHDTRQTMPVMADIFDVSTGNPWEVNAFRVVEKSNNYEILYDQTHTVRSYPTNNNQKAIVPLKIHIPIGRHQKYITTGKTEGDKVNGLYISFCGIGGANNPSLQLASRIRFYDN